MKLIIKNLGHENKSFEINGIRTSEEAIKIVYDVALENCASSDIVIKDGGIYAGFHKIGEYQILKGDSNE